MKRSLSDTRLAAKRTCNTTQDATSELRSGAQLELLDLPTEILTSIVLYVHETPSSPPSSVSVRYFALRETCVTLRDIFDHALRTGRLVLPNPVIFVGHHEHWNDASQFTSIATVRNVFPLQRCRRLSVRAFDITHVDETALLGLDSLQDLRVHFDAPCTFKHAVSLDLRLLARVSTALQSLRIKVFVPTRSCTLVGGHSLSLLSQSLQALTLWRVGEDNDLDALSSLQALTQLKLFDIAAPLGNLSALTALRTLELNECHNIAGGWLLGNPAELRALKVGNCLRRAACVLDCIDRMTQLCTLELAHASFTLIPSALCSSLRQLRLTSCSVWTIRDMAYSRWPRLETLVFFQCHMTSECFGAVLNRLGRTHHVRNVCLIQEEEPNNDKLVVDAEFTLIEPRV